MITAKPINVDEYISGFAEDIRQKLQLVRSTIKESAPLAEEVISYSMPAFRQNGILVYYAAHKEHIGFYPTSSGMLAFKDELSEFKTSKGAVQFPFNKSLPVNLIQEIVKFRVKENAEKATNKKKKV